MKFEQIIIVRSKTQLEEIIAKFNSRSQAQFYLERSGRDFHKIVRDHKAYYSALEYLKTIISKHEKYKIIDRSFLSNYMFTDKDLIIGFGQDGLVANIAKYAKGQPILGYNPVPSLYDGILLPFNKLDSGQIKAIMNNDFNSRSVVMAKAAFNDGQELLAFNDFFIGPKSHTSAKYEITFNKETESQSSSGLIISTGIGSTGWMSSISNMMFGITGESVNLSLDPTQKKLIFVVREPFISKTSNCSISLGIITKQNPLKLASQMVDTGILFSDGMEDDFIPFNIGSSVEISVANTSANLISEY